MSATTTQSVSADPVSAIANAIGSIFNVFGGITDKTRSEGEQQTALLLASQPQRPKVNNMELYFFVGMMILLVLVILFKLVL
jgi:hypothetical protein